MTPTAPSTAISPAQCRAARALTDIDLAVLADEAALPSEAVDAFEGGYGVLHASQMQRLRNALERLGIEFLPEAPDGGVGVRLRFSADQARRIEAWEGEGGTPGDDDVR